jgi:dolichyl-phosphate-mannose--protein O-mannosyl transferase
LGKYFIAAGIWLSQWLPVSRTEATLVAGFPLPPVSFRWMNALTGALIPPAVAGLAFQLSGRRRLALIAGGFAALDGLLLVESRYALIDIYLVLFGVLAQWLLLLALARPPEARRGWLVLSGIAFGAAVAVKWSGLGFLLGVLLAWAAALLTGFLRIAPTAGNPRRTEGQGEAQVLTDLRTRLLQLRPLQALLWLGVVPALVYAIAWVPQFQRNPQFEGFWEWQKYALASHQSIGSGPKEHPYCSEWQTWPLLLRPVGIYFQRESLPPAAATGARPAVGREVFVDVHGMGNPALWWLSTAAMAFLAWSALRLGILLSSNLVIPGARARILGSPGFWVAVYLSANYLAHFLPWMAVRRCVFLYHYLEAAVFAFLALAWLTDSALRHPWRPLRWAGAVVLAAVAAGFVYWLPVFLGLPLTPEQFAARMWLRSWI